MKGKAPAFEAKMLVVPGVDGANNAFPYKVKNEVYNGRVKGLAAYDGKPCPGSLGRLGTPGTSSASAGISRKNRQGPR